MNCEKFIEIIAAGEDATAAERADARAHAEVCPECRALAEAFGDAEEAMSRVPPAPAGFAERVMARLPFKRPAVPAVRPVRKRRWLASAIAALVGGVGLTAVAAFQSEAIVDGAESFAAAAENFDPSTLLSAAGTGNVIGGVAAGAIVVAFFLCYYLVPTR
ncbi:MAG: hypothetical protein PVH29_08780 [Candidatus Zixiibacteriota bacterium]|jgi:hypothetical protein